MNQSHRRLQPPPRELPPPQLAAGPLPSPINHRNASQIFGKAIRIIISYPITFFFVFSLVFTFRYNVEHVSKYLISFVDNDPSLKSFISRLDLTGYHHYYHYNQHPYHHHLRRRRRAFLHLSRVGTLDDDFFSGDADYDRSLFNPSTKAQPNGTFVWMNYKLGFPSGPIEDNGILYSQVIHSRGFVFKPPPEILEGPQEKSVLREKNGSIEDLNAVVDSKFLMKELESGRSSDVSSMVYFVGIFSAGYGYLILAFLVTYTWANGIAFDRVFNDLLGRSKSIYMAVWDGSTLGIKRLSAIVLMRWALRDAISQLMGMCFFGLNDDQYIFFKVLLRLKLMPFSDDVPWVTGIEKESLGFWIIWCLVELVSSFLFPVLTWVAVVDTRKSGREVLKEGCDLLGTLLYPALEIKCWELLTCRWLMRWLFSVTVGEVFFLAFQSFMEVYFMVAWLLFYLVARHKDAISSGKEFGHREMEGILEAMK